MRKPARVPGARLAMALAVAAALSACTVSAGPTYPPVGTTPQPAGAATDSAKAQLASALSVEGIQLTDPSAPYRPPEGAIFAAAPRTIVQAVLPDDPTGGYLVLYAFGTPQQALAGAQDQAQYVASGPGKAQVMAGTQFEIRTLGNVAIFFAWRPDAALDAREASIPLALSTIGNEVPIPG
ncbi:MAG TPA: hypothetical protein VF484_01545 [Candidatus Limnocylindrales bacterium]